MTTNNGPAIVAQGVYLPKFRRSGRTPVTVRNGDEDTLTLAVEAAQRLLAGAAERLGEIDELQLAVASPETVGGPQLRILSEALGLRAEVTAAMAAGDALAGLTALYSAIDAVAVGRARSVLVVASEPGDGVRVSAAAVALLVARPSDGPGLRLLDRRSRADVVYGNWVDRHDDRHSGDLRHLDHAVAGLAVQTWDDLTGAGAASPDVVTGVAAAAVARACGATPDAVLPDHGVAGPLLALLNGAHIGPGRMVHVLAATASVVVAVAAHADAGGPSWRPPNDDRAIEPPVEPDCSPRLSLPTSSPFFQRAARELLRLEGARCRSCRQVAFPPSQRPVCSGCHGYDFEPVALSPTGSVHTYVINRFLPQGFGDEMTFVLGDMDDGSRYWAPTSGIRAGELAIGDPVELRLRRFTEHGGAPAYAMKFVAPQLEVA